MRVLPPSRWHPLSSHDPSIRCVVVINDTNETNMEVAKEVFIYEDSDISERIVAEVYGEGYARLHYPGTRRTDARENGRRERTNGQRNSGKTPR